MVKKVQLILDSYQRDQGLLAFILSGTQVEYNELPKEALIQISQGLDVCPNYRDKNLANH